jgi:hypothetical protein
MAEVDLNPDHFTAREVTYYFTRLALAPNCADACSPVSTTWMELAALASLRTAGATRSK